MFRGKKIDRSIIGFLISGMVGGSLFSAFFICISLLYGFSRFYAIAFSFLPIGLLGGYIGFWFYKKLIKSPSKLAKIGFLFLSVLLGLGLSFLFFYVWSWNT